jgi:hypothetical protein
MECGAIAKCARELVEQALADIRPEAGVRLCTMNIAADETVNLHISFDDQRSPGDQRSQEEELEDAVRASIVRFWIDRADVPHFKVKIHLYAMSTFDEADEHLQKKSLLEQ